MSLKTKRLRLVLGDQLNSRHSWFKESDPDTLYILAELTQETNYVKHHVQKVCAFFAAMEDFAENLRQAGHRVKYFNLDESSGYKDLPALLSSVIERCACQVFEYQQPDEYRLHVQLREFTRDLEITSRLYETEHFFLEHNELPLWFEGGRHHRMEGFYRKMRKRFSVLMEGDSPLGGKWNHDEDNRHALKKKDLADIPQPLVFENDVSVILKRLNDHEIVSFGNANIKLVWPINHRQAMAQLQYFCQVCLPKFGYFQDAMTCNSPHSWSLYHSRLSFALNAKIISPDEVIDVAIETYYQQQSSISISQIEGFVRQILGWREYVRGMYWANMPDYTEQNRLNASRPLPSWFWTGETKMACMKESIKQSLEYAYAHHIQRLMITGNFSLLAGLHPDEVDDWYLGIYIDALQWVELPNTRGMALFADGGWIATKPYAASGNYINKMSDYCKSCHYKVKEKVTPDACPFNALYWDFFGRHEERLADNQRLSFIAKQWAKKSDQEKQLIHERALTLLDNIETI